MSAAPRLIGPCVLAQFLRRNPPGPLSLVRLIGHLDVELAFRELVRRLLPDQAEAILAGRYGRADAEAERAWAFCTSIESRYFPIYEYDEVEPLVYSIPFQRFGWSYDAFHGVDQRPGTLMLRALCAEPYDATMRARVPLLEAVEALGVPRVALRRVPHDGVSPTDLHAKLDGTRFAAVAEFADWTWGQTDLAFLDFDDEVEVGDADWSDEVVQDLSRQWQTAQAIMNRVAALEEWLEQAPALHFAELLDAVLREPSEAAAGRLDVPTLAEDHTDESVDVTLSTSVAA